MAKKKKKETQKSRTSRQTKVARGKSRQTAAVRTRSHEAKAARSRSATRGAGK